VESEEETDEERRRNTKKRMKKKLKRGVRTIAMKGIWRRVRRKRARK